MAFRRIILICIVVHSLMCSETYAQGNCPYQYTIQPPEDIVCNPYANQFMMMQCTLIGPDMVELEWYFSPMDMGESIQLHNNSKYSIKLVNGPKNITSKIRINDLNEESDSGIYWCLGIFSDGSKLQSPSSSFELKSEEEYGFFDMCRPLLYLKSSKTKCTVPAYDTEIPGSNTTNSTNTYSTNTTNSITESIETTSFEISMETVTKQQEPSSFNRTLIIITAFICVLLIICITLFIVIGVQFRRRNKLTGYHNRPHPSPKNEVYSSAEFAKSSGEYAEIGPAIMDSVKEHLAQPHYTMNNSMTKLAQPSSLNGERNMDHIIQNPYDIPGNPKIADASSTIEKLPGMSDNYSKLERNFSVNSARKSAHDYVPEISLLESCTTDTEQNDNTLSTEVDTTPQEHYYHILEDDTNAKQPSEKCKSLEPNPVPLLGRAGAYDQLRKPVKLSTEDHLKIEDIPNSSYSHLDLHDPNKSQAMEGGNSQHYLMPICSSQPSAKDRTDNSSDETSVAMKYSGDYERDPFYMERLQQGNTNGPPHPYQALVLTDMNSTDEYTKLQGL